MLGMIQKKNLETSPEDPRIDRQRKFLFQTI
jgi:hypothetical protein